MFLLTQLTGAVVFEVTTGLYYWFFAGLMMLLARLDSELPSATQAVSARPAPTPRRVFA
jgi:hypothetical protein